MNGIYRPLSVSIALMSMWPSVSVAESTTMTGIFYNVASLDVAGVRLGMTPNMVHQALDNSGYALSKQEKRNDFAGRVEQAAMERRGEFIGPRTHFSADIGHENYIGTSSQEVSVSYAPTLSGMKVSKVTYQVEVDYLDATTFLSTTERKYGRPSQIYYYFTASPQTYTYCDNLDPKCGQGRPRLTAVVVQPFGFDKKWRTLDLDQGRIAEDANLAAIAAAVDQAVPKIGAPQF
jgi:hypothetical protein